MPLSPIQKGAVGQFAFLITALVTGKGQLEVYVPSADNEGRDAEVRRHLKPESSIAIQIKVAQMEELVKHLLEGFDPESSARLDQLLSRNRRIAVDGHTAPAAAAVPSQADLRSGKLP